MLASGDLRKAAAQARIRDAAYLALAQQLGAELRMLFLDDLPEPCAIDSL